MGVGFWDCGFWDLLLNPAAADDDISVVEDDGLARRDGGLGLIEDHLGPAVWQRADGPGARLVPVADLRGDARSANTAARSKSSSRLTP